MIKAIRNGMALILLIVGTMFVQARDNANELMTVLYHEGNLCDRIVLFFSQDSACSLVPESVKEMPNNNKKVVFFVPNTHMSGAAVQHVSKIKKGIQRKNMACAMNVYESKGGLAIEVAYDPSKISVQQSLFDPINTSSHRKGIVFNLYENNKLDKLKSYHDTTIHYAFNQPVKKKNVL